MLLVDVGNSRIKWMHEVDISARAPARAATWRDRPLDEVLDRHWKGLPVPEAVVVANVAGPAAARVLTAWCSAHWRLAPLFMRTTAEACGVRNGYRVPAELGVDRWAALVGAHWEVPGPKVVADAGSALTVDLLAADGSHEGGFIAPGVAAMERALEALAPHVFSRALPPVPEGAGRSTGEGVAAGTAGAAAGLIRHAVQLLARGGEGVTVVLCGGEAPRLEPLLPPPVRLEPDLVLHGLAGLARAQGGAENAS